VRDQFKESADCLERGLKANTFNEALNNDMRRVLHDVQERLGKQPAAPQGDGVRPLPSAARVLSAYRDNRGDEESRKK